jgi:alpha/beta superfamily hydrolase
MREHAVQFGPGGRLVGVLCEPDADRRRAGAPALIVSNIGFNHRPAPFRLYVELSRRIARLSITTLRFDLSGRGDSGPRRDARPDADGAVEDTREAMAWLAERRKAERFLLLGLCSGTDAAHALAASDARVVGAVFIDGYAYATLRSRVRFWVHRRFSCRHWARLFRCLRLGVRRSDLATDEIFIREYPSRERMAADLGAMLARDVRLLFIYTSDVEHVYNYDGQFHDMLAPARLRGRIELERYPDADHLFSVQRERLLARIGAFVDKHWPEGGLP